MTALTLPNLTLADDYTHPLLGTLPGQYSYAVLGEPGGLTQFGVHIEVLHPGARSSFRHWHEAEDEMIYMISGELVLIEDHETMLRRGDVACWAKGAGPAHCLENRSTEDATYLIIGTRNRVDVIHYPDHDLIAHKDGTERRWTYSDGSPREAGG